MSMEIIPVEEGNASSSTKILRIPIPPPPPLLSSGFSQGNRKEMSREIIPVEEGNASSSTKMLRIPTPPPPPLLSSGFSQWNRKEMSREIIPVEEGNASSSTKMLRIPTPPPPPLLSSGFSQWNRKEMSREVIPVEEGNASSSTKKLRYPPLPPLVSSPICAVQPWDLLDQRKAFNLEVSSHLTGGDYHTKQYLASEKGHKYVKLLNPTQFSVKPFLDRVKEPSVLLMRGCELLLQSGSFPFDKFKSITILEISGCRRLTTLPENTISQMTQLESLNLSYLQIHQLPSDMFLNATDSLRSLVLKSCPNLNVLPEPCMPLDMLEYLDLSYLLVETLPDRFIPDGLRSLILRGCSKLCFVQLDRLFVLQKLDLCYCTSLKAYNISNFKPIRVLDLSYTGFSWRELPNSISHLFLRSSKFLYLRKLYWFMSDIKVCDLSGNQFLVDITALETCLGLEALNLSKTRIESIDFLSEFTYMRTLVLRECTWLKQLPTVEQLENLEVLDLLGCESLCSLPQGLSKQRRLKELNLCGCKSLTELVEGLFDDMSSLEKLDLSQTYIKNLPSFTNLINRGTIINYSSDSVLESSTVLTELCSDNLDSQDEFHLVSTFITDSGFDKFRYRFAELSHYLLFLEEKFAKSIAYTKASDVKMQFKSIRDDLKYILGKVDLLESSQNCTSSEELLHQLMSYDYHNHDDTSSILKKLLRMVTKLKILVPPFPPKPLSREEGGKKLKPSPEELNSEIRLQTLPNDYASLTDIQRNCLLYLACITVAISGDKMIKESVLIHLWYGEGFFDPLLSAYSTINQVPSTSNLSSRIRTIGLDILHDLACFSLVQEQLEEKKWYIVEPNSSFVIRKAMEEHWFDFNKRGKLTPHFGVSRRACLLKSDIDHPPSSLVWLNYTKSFEQLDNFQHLRTLLYIDEPIVDINTEWFSSMTNLYVLHLVDLYSERQIDIVDLNFLEELKNMKQLRLLNLESFAVIQKLPDSICQLTNLTILNLAHCSNLTELPAGIASLANLIILDLTQCHLLHELPKGLASLSKLEVLKGFPITYDADGRQSKKACILRELLKLKSLTKLSLIVNKASFPDATDLQVFRNMEELRNLKITWYQSIYKKKEVLRDAVEQWFAVQDGGSSGDAVQNGVLRQSRWKQMRCWRPHNETEEVEVEMLLTNRRLRKINKLVLCCFPFRTEPDWLCPTQLPKLERLYILGGRLETLFGGYKNERTWTLKALKLKYLSYFVADWEDLKNNMPSISYDLSGERCCPYARDFRQC